MRRVGYITLVTLLLGGGLGQARADVRELAAIRDELGGLALQLQTLVAEYANPDIAQAKSFSDRLADGEILYLLGDYQRASLVLMELASRPSYKSQPLYDKALYYLAESLFQIGNDMLARGYFQDLITGGSREYTTDAIRRLIQLSDRLRRFEGVRDHIEAYMARQPLPPDVAYIYAKSLLMQGKHAEVRRAAAVVPREHRLFPKAQYMLGVARTAEGDLPGATEVFRAIVGLQGQYDDLDDVRDHAAMNIGRILLEDGKVGESIDAYQNVRRSSPLFEEALYEVTWNFVRSASTMESEQARAAEYRKAQNALEILLLSESQTTLAPEARLLLGNILLRLEAFDEANATFESVVDLYRPVRDELRRLSGEVEDPVTYYDEVAERTRGGQSLLPPLAKRWAAEQSQLKGAMGLVGDIDRSEAWIRDAEQIVDKLMVVLDSDRAAQFFPTLREASTRYSALRNSLMAIGERLLGVEREVLLPNLAPADRAALDVVLRKRAELEPKVRALPATAEDYEGRLATLQSRVAELQRAAYQLRFPIQSMRNEVQAMRQWFSTQGKAMSKRESSAFLERAALQETEISELERLQGELEAELVLERDKVALVAGERSSDLALRGAYYANLDEERHILARATGNVDRATMDRVAEQRDIMARYMAELESFRRRLDSLVAEQSRNVVAQVAREQAELVRYRQWVDEARSEAREVVGGIAAASLEEVSNQFRDIVLRADVGIVDVAWQLKEEQTHEISRRVSEQARELQVLDAEFSEVLDQE